MIRYYCPYCSPRYQICEKRSDGVFVCGHCGDPMLKIPFLKTTQIFALISILAFVLPAMLVFFSSLKDIERENQQNNSKKVAILANSRLNEAQ